MRLAAAVSTLALCLTSCALFDSSQALRTQALPPPGAGAECLHALATGTVQANPADPARVWLDAGGRRVDLSWPYGFRVRFTPRAEVLAPTGEVVAREGETVRLGGGTVNRVFEICTINGVTWLTAEVVVPALP